MTDTGNRTEARFDKTHWSVILPAANQQAPGAQAALEQLCKIYWPPLYAFLRRQGRSAEDAKDLTQGFFVHLLAKDRLQNVGPAKGKFRTFLLASLNNYVQNERDKEHAVKRGGGQMLIPIDTAEAEERCGIDPADEQDPARIFERRWASTLISESLGQLKQKYAQAGKAGWFDALHPFLTGDAAHGAYAEAAARLNMNEGAVRTAASRLRNDYRELLRAEVARTLESPAEVEEEIGYLFSIFQGR